MRKGGRRNDWKVADERYLIENAGRIPRREICQHLRRSNESVKQKAKALRMQGIPVSSGTTAQSVSRAPRADASQAT